MHTPNKIAPRITQFFLDLIWCADMNPSLVKTVAL